MYDMPGQMNSSVDLFSWINQVTQNAFFPLLIVGIYIIILVKMLFNPSNSASKSFAAASFMTMIISVFARILDFVSTGFMSTFIILTAAGGIWMHVENKSGA